MELLAEIWDKDVGVRKDTNVEYKLDGIKAMKKNTNPHMMSYYVGASRAIIVNSKKEVLIQHSKTYSYYKLPGGKIENDEDIFRALHREIMEETGYKIVVTQPVGLIIEHRNHREKFKITKISYCYLAKVNGKQEETHLEEGEKFEGFELKWINIKRAFNLVKNGDKKTYQVRFIIKRDAIFIKKAIGLLYGKTARD